MRTIQSESVGYLSHYCYLLGSNTWVSTVRMDGFIAGFYGWQSITRLTLYLWVEEMNDQIIFLKIYTIFSAHFDELCISSGRYICIHDQLLQLLCLPLSWFIRLALALAYTICNSTFRIRNWISPFLQLPTQVGSLSTRRTRIINIYGWWLLCTFYLYL